MDRSKHSHSLYSMFIAPQKNGNDKYTAASAYGQLTSRYNNISSRKPTAKRKKLGPIIALQPRHV